MHMLNMSDQGPSTWSALPTEEHRAAEVDTSKACHPGMYCLPLEQDRDDGQACAAASLLAVSLAVSLLFTLVLLSLNRARRPLLTQLAR